MRPARDRTLRRVAGAASYDAGRRRLRPRARSVGELHAIDEGLEEAKNVASPTLRGDEAAPAPYRARFTKVDNPFAAAHGYNLERGRKARRAPRPPPAAQPGAAARGSPASPRPLRTRRRRAPCGHRDRREGLRVGLVAHLRRADAVRRRAHGHASCHWIFRAQRVQCTWTERRP